MAHTVAYAYVGYRDVFSDAPAREGLSYYLRRLPKVWLAETLGKIGATLFNSNKFYLNPNQQIEFVQGFKQSVAFDTDRIIRVLAKGERVFAHPEIVATLTKYALLYGSEDTQVPSYAYDYLLRSLLLLNSQFGEARNTQEPQTDPPDPMIFLRYELDSMLASHENFSFLMARYYRFMKWAGAQRPDSDYYLPVADDFQQFFGITYDQYATAAFAVVIPFVSRVPIAQWKAQLGILDVNVAFSTLKDISFIESWLSGLSLSAGEAAQNLSERAPSYGLSDLRPFIDKPLLQIDHGRFACPYQGFLRNRLGVGLYFAIWDYYNSRSESDARRFSQFFGRFLEEYVHGVITEGSKSRSDVSIFPEIRYKTSLGESKSSDVILVAGENAIFMDVTRSRFRLDETNCDEDPAWLAKDIEKIFVQKSKQLDRSIRDFQAGAYELGGINPSSIKRFFPVIVTEQDFPQVIALPVLIRTAIQSAGFLSQWEDVQLLETLYLSAEARMDLEGVIARKVDSPQYRHRDLPSYLYDCEHEKIAGNGATLPGYREFFEVIVYPKLREWGLQMPEATGDVA